MSRPERQDETEKPPRFRKLGERVKDISSLGQTLVKEPKAFPRQTAETLRPWFRKAWKTKGGGLYACGFVVTFIYLEVVTVVSEILSSEGVVDFFTAQLLEFFFRFFGESLQNMIHAFIWPVEVIAFSPPWGIAILVAMYLLFTYLVKEPLEKWLFHEEE